MKISRESLKSLQGSGGPTCPDDPAFGMCFLQAGQMEFV